MPTYEYACRDCGQHLEVVQSFRESALTDCPACSGRLRKVYGAAGIIFKGSGYYVNDSRAKASKGAESPAGNGEAGSKTETKSEAKSDGGESKAEPKREPAAKSA
jgi:putative FmdB family regulatory protein